MDDEFREMDGPPREKVGSRPIDELVEIERALDTQGARAILAAIGIEAVETIIHRD